MRNSSIQTILCLFLVLPSLFPALSVASNWWWDGGGRQRKYPLKFGKIYINDFQTETITITFENYATAEHVLTIDNVFCQLEQHCHGKVRVTFWWWHCTFSLITKKLTRSKKERITPKVLNSIRALASSSNMFSISRISLNLTSFRECTIIILYFF